ncbi:MAG TPA: LutB/LldF family L-lactate oxidation iron-sulfur protein [Stellaceae bacterium]|nr:LutB/LldF family L-lactate oxidation iron-sulfur protein [Stellaceae bacterium]
MHPTSRAFPENAHRALGDAILQQSLGIMMRQGFAVRRAKVVARLPEFEALREEARALKDHVLEHLDFYLETFERNVKARGGLVHWCRTAEEARATVLEICRAAGARTVTKGKTMIGEEIAINDHLEANGIKPVETDLGEYIIQIRREPPSHIVAPAVHLAKEQVAESFRRTHRHLDPARPLDEPRQMLDEARAILRQKFLAAEVGITGANILVAETGSSIIVTNEGNGDLTQTLPKVHIVLASIEKVVPTLEDATLLLRLLARSATGQEFSTYTTVSTGPRRPGDPDGPNDYHVVLVDNGRSALMGSEMQDMLRCIRCAACLNHCPVYGAVGGHAYGWVYPGPMGAVLTPTLLGIGEAAHLPNASTLCGKCESVCPVKIPLPRLMRHWRERAFEQDITPRATRWGLSAWAYLAERPPLYRLVSATAARVLGWLGRGHGRFRTLPLAGGWTSVRDMPAPEGRSFMSLWTERRR